MNLSDGAHMEVPMSNQVLSLGERIVMAARLAAVEHIAQELAEQASEQPQIPPMGGRHAAQALTARPGGEAPRMEVSAPVTSGFVARMRGNIARMLHVGSGREVA